MRSTFAVVAIAIVCAGCAHSTGRDFQKPNPSQVVVGKTTFSEIMAVYGQPAQRESDSRTDTGQKPASAFDFYPVAGSYDSVTYSYALLNPPALGNTLAIRSVNFAFRDHVLVGYNFISGFQNDSSDFDENRLSQISRGSSTKSQVVQLIGEPTGHAIYPMVSDEGGEKYIYGITSYDLGARTRLYKRLEIVFDGQDIVKDYRIQVSTTPLTVTQSPTPTIVPIFTFHK